MPALRRVAPILLLVAFTLLGTGTLGYVHDLAHAIEDRAAAHSHHPGHGHHHGDGEDHDHPPVHNELTCALHAMLRGPLVASTAVPVLILLGLFVAFLTQLTPVVVSVRPACRLDCRGPPSC